MRLPPGTAPAARERRWSPPQRAPLRHRSQALHFFLPHWDLPAADTIASCSAPVIRPRSRKSFAVLRDAGHVGAVVLPRLSHGQSLRDRAAVGVDHLARRGRHAAGRRSSCTPSSSRSASQASPAPSPSASAWSGFGSSGQLSASSARRRRRRRPHRRRRPRRPRRCRPGRHWRSPGSCRGRR